MKQLITFCRDTEALIAELQEKHPSFLNESDGEISFLVTKTNTLRNGLLTLSNVVPKTFEQEEILRSLTSIEVLGTFDEIEADAVKLAKFKEVYDFTIDLDGFDEDGVAIKIPQIMRWRVHA